MNLRTRLVSCISLLILTVVCNRGDSITLHASDEETDKQYVRVINGFLEGRKKIERGLARYTMNDRYVIESDGTKQTSDIRGLYVFDYPERLLRIDADLRTTDEHGVEAKNVITSYQYADQSDKTLLRQPKDAAPRQLLNVRTERPDYVTRFDIRVLGALHAVGWDRMTLSELAENFERGQDDVAEVQKDGDRVRVSLIFKKDGKARHRRDIVFREDRDFCPELLEVKFPKRIDGQLPAVDGQIEWNAPSQTQQMEVMRFQDQWVPKKVVIMSRPDKRQHELEFQWLTLNQPLNPKSFDLDFDPTE